MKTQIAAIAILAAIAGTASAQTLTRADVRAQVLAAHAAGTLSSGGEGYQSELFVTTAPGRPRAEVRAEAVAARAAGTLAEGEAYPGPLPASNTRTRADVRAELAASRATGAQAEGEAYPLPLALR
jgi:hypothetical protein